MGIEILVSLISFAALIITWAIAPSGAAESTGEALVPARVPSTSE